MVGRISQIMVQTGLLAVLLHASLAAQSRIAGRVLEAGSNSPIAGATVFLSGTLLYTLSDNAGAFRLTVPALPATIVAVRLGFQPDTAVVSGASVVLELSAAALALEPVLIASERNYSLASSSLLRELDITLRPRDSSQRLLSLAPGLVIAQHAGGGKAEQIFLRGFDADHGTDVAISVDGVPVNMVSHGHGQGYADLHFLLPEVVERVETRKGPYDVRDGDFATAGAVSFRTRERVAATLIARAGGFGQRQAVALAPLGSATAAGGYLAAGWQRSDGPFDAPQHHSRLNLFGKWTAPLGSSNLSVSASGFDASWDASGQVPQRLIERGVITRFGAVDPSEGGHTSRYDLLARISDGTGARRWEAEAFATRYRFRLFSNFTFALNDPDNGDGIEQVDRRTLLGARSELNGASSLLGRTGLWAAGASVRNDVIDVALHNQSERTRLGTRVDDQINQTHLCNLAQAGAAAHEFNSPATGRAGRCVSFRRAGQSHASRQRTSARLRHALGRTGQPASRYCRRHRAGHIAPGQCRVWLPFK